MCRRTMFLMESPSGKAINPQLSALTLETPAIRRKSELLRVPDA